MSLFDASFALELERIGFHADGHPLWTSGASDEQTREVYKRFRHAGCQFVSTNTYHASQSLVKSFLQNNQDLPSKASADSYIEDPVNIAKEIFTNGQTVLGSIGPYGVSLRDASEYTGNYVDCEEHLQAIVAYQREQITLLKKSGISVVLYETVPAAIEAEYLLKVLDETETNAIVSFSCKGLNLRHGESFSKTIGKIINHDKVRGIGINCTHPNDVSALLKSIDALNIKKHVFVYPNSGESWDPERNCWIDAEESIDWRELTMKWLTEGATVIGGCCRVGTETLREIKKSIDEWKANGHKLRAIEPINTP